MPRRLKRAENSLDADGQNLREVGAAGKKGKGRLGGRKPLESIELVCTTRDDKGQGALEVLTLDRRTRTAGYRYRPDELADASITYNDTSNQVQSLLERLDKMSDKIIKAAKPSKANGSQARNDGPIYRLTLQRRNQPSEIIEAPYDPANLPREWALFLEETLDFLRFSFVGNMGNIFDLSLFQYRLKTDDIICCNVSVEGGGAARRYRTKDASLMLGDHVLVPWDSPDDRRTGMIESIEHFWEEELAKPSEDIPEIIDRAEGKAVASQRLETFTKLSREVLEKQIDLYDKFYHKIYKTMEEMNCLRRDYSDHTRDRHHRLEFVERNAGTMDMTECCAWLTFILRAERWTFNPGNGVSGWFASELRSGHIAALLSRMCELLSGERKGENAAQ